jgi:hypothetical protein
MVVVHSEYYIQMCAAAGTLPYAWFWCRWKGQSARHHIALRSSKARAILDIAEDVESENDSA